MAPGGFPVFQATLFMVNYPQTLLTSHNVNTIILKVKKKNYKKIICETNISCLTRMELLEKFHFH